jgi:hypothetical protein
VIGKYLDYFEKRLPKSDFEMIKDAVNRYLKREGIDRVV